MCVEGWCVNQHFKVYNERYNIELSIENDYNNICKNIVLIDRLLSSVQGCTTQEEVNKVFEIVKGDDAINTKDDVIKILAII